METKRYLIILSLVITISFGENSTTTTNLIDQTSTESGTTLSLPSFSSSSSSSASSSSSDAAASTSTTTVLIKSTTQQQNSGGPNQSQNLVVSSTLGGIGSSSSSSSSSNSISAGTIPVTQSITVISATASSVTTTSQLEQITIESLPPEIIDTEHEIMGSGGPDSREIVGIQKALEWLKMKRLSDYGWENDTHMVILAKELSGGQDPIDSDNHVAIIAELEYKLSIKEMEVEILSLLDRHHTVPKPINADKVARYVLALGSLCKDPKRFYGHDLVAILQHHEPAQDQEFALAALSVCSSGSHVRKRQIRRLLDIASSGTDHSVDTLAMVILALRCIVTDHRHRHLQHFVRRPTRGLASIQDARGGFGSLRSTALAIQALQDIEPDPASTWNRSAASKWILDRQRVDGGWSEEPVHDGQDPGVGIGLTAEIILALGWKGLKAVRELQCDFPPDPLNINDSNGNGDNGKVPVSNGNGSVTPSDETEPKNITYTYTLWVGTNVTEAFSLSLTSPRNTSFFYAMRQAADLDTRFAFEANTWPNGHYVHTLAGKKEEPRGYNYWLLYRLPELPDPSNPPGNQLIAPVGVDELKVEGGEHYLYWYKKL